MALSCREWAERGESLGSNSGLLLKAQSISYIDNVAQVIRPVRTMLTGLFVLLLQSRCHAGCGVAGGALGIIAAACLGTWRRADRGWNRLTA